MIVEQRQVGRQLRPSRAANEAITLPLSRKAVTDLTASVLRPN